MHFAISKLFKFSSSALGDHSSKVPTIWMDFLELDLWISTLVEKCFWPKIGVPAKPVRETSKTFSLYLVQSSGKPSLSLVLLSRRRAAHFCSLKKNSKKVILIRNTLQIEFFPSVYLRIFHDLKFMPFCMDGRSPAGKQSATNYSITSCQFFLLSFCPFHCQSCSTGLAKAG